MKTALKVIIGIAGVIVLGVAAIFYFTNALVATADGFFQAVGRQDMAAARGYLAEDFKANTDDAALRAFLSRSALLHFKEASWSNRQVSVGRGELRGSITTDSGGVVPITLTFVKENDAWKIYSIQKPTAGALSGEGADAVPTPAEQVALARRTMDDFAESVRAGNMQHFRASTSQLWQKQFPLQKFEDAFGSAYGMKSAFDAIAGQQPELEPASALAKHGVLLIEGSFAGKSDKVDFDAKYILEGADWKLIGFHFKIW